MKNTVLENVLEALDAFEDRAGVRLSALSALLLEYEDDAYLPTLTVLGEVRAREGVTLERPITIVASAYDSSGRLIANSEANIDVENFLDFDTFVINMHNVPTKVFSKIRVVPRFS